MTDLTRIALTSVKHEPGQTKSQMTETALLCGSLQPDIQTSDKPAGCSQPPPASLIASLHLLRRPKSHSSPMKQTDRGIGKLEIALVAIAEAAFLVGPSSSMQAAVSSATQGPFARLLPELLWSRCCDGAKHAATLPADSALACSSLSPCGVV